MNVLYILLGWFLGILSPGLVKRILDGYKKIALRRTIVNELKDIKNRLACIPMKVYPAYGALDLRLFKWVQEQTQNFTCFISDNDDKKVLEELCLKSDAEIVSLINTWNTRRKSENPSFHFKTMETSILDSNLINIEILDNDFLVRLLEIKFQIRTFNEEVKSVNEYLKMTFDSNITDENHQIIKQEIENKNHFISEKASYIVGVINNTI